MRLWNVGIALLAGLILCDCPISRADTPPVLGGGAGFQPFGSWGPACQPDARRAFAQPGSPYDLQLSLPDAAWEEPIALPAPYDASPRVVPAAQFVTQNNPSWIPPSQGILPPPPAQQESIVAGQPVNGTWRDEGDFVVIEVNGQQLRLAKSALAPTQPGAPSPVKIPTGSVHGRLLQGGRPLANCTVVIVPMHKDGATDDNGVRQPMSATTDADGVYGFENVPVGSYKLTWLPAGAQQWIRRIEMKPDVFVHEGQDVTLKDIRSATRTIN